MKFTVSFECDNAEFDENLNEAIAKVLREVANTVADRNAGMSGYIKDWNGNGIGRWHVSE